MLGVIVNGNLTAFKRSAPPCVYHFFGTWYLCSSPLKQGGLQRVMAEEERAFVESKSLFFDTEGAVRQEVTNENFI